MSRRIVRAMAILPGAALIVPALILGVTGVLGFHEGRFDTAAPAFWLALLFVAGGLALAGWTLRLPVVGAASPSALVDSRGELAIRGPYRHCRNPLVCASLLLLVGEALLFDSWPLAVWLAAFYVACAVYIPRVEERRLERRFGAAWRRYKAQVPRWFPSPLAYDPEAKRREVAGPR